MGTGVEFFSWGLISTSLILARKEARFTVVASLHHMLRISHNVYKRRARHFCYQRIVRNQIDSSAI